MSESDCLYFQIYYSNGQIVELAKTGPSITIGRRSKTGSRLADLYIDDPFASRRHSRVFRDPQTPDQWLLEDMGSNNGTRLDGVPIASAVPIKEGSWILIGTTRITFNHESQISEKIPEVHDAANDPRGSQVAQPPSELPAQSATGEIAPEDEATVVRVPDAAGIIAPEDEATIVRVPDAAGIIAPEDEATIVRPPLPVTTPSVSPDDEATVVRPASGSAVLPPSDGKAATLVPPKKDNATRTKPVPKEAAPDTSQSAKHEEKPKADTVAVPGAGTLQAAMLHSHAAHHWPTGSVANLHSQDPLKISVNSNMIQNIIAANYIDEVQATEILKTAQKEGQTFFLTLVQDQSVQNILEMILTNVSETFDLEYIHSPETLATQAEEVGWLSYARALELGCVLLKTDPSVVGTVRYAALDPFDVTLRDWVERCSQAHPRCVLVHPETFSTVIQNLKSKSSEQGDGVGLSIDFSAHAETHIRDQIQDVDVPQMVNYFLHRAHLQGASDIHIEPTEEFLLVRLRVDGILQKEISLPMVFHSEMASRLKILSGMDVVEKRRPQDGRLAVVIRNNPIDVRVSSYPTVYGEKFVLRLLDKNALRPSIETLGLMERDRRLLREKLAAPYGLVMISGPTGSGKTTTLYSCLGGMDRNRKNVLTVEDPVEYRMAGIHQMQVNSKIGLTFASGLRTILRQDPDVIMVGETRDGETASMAVQASLTGHIVFSTIHTNDAVGVITRLLDMGIEPFLVSTSLSLAVAQRLVRTICKHCRMSVSGQTILTQLQKDGITIERLKTLDIFIDPHVDYTQGSGCSRCRDTGYQGRRAVFEMFEMTDEARNLIMAGNVNSSQLKALAREKGMTTLISHGVRLVEEEVTTFEEVVRVLGEEN
ncbi:MAG: FHA protein [Magnetococcales bacterium]|nr:FHA protein [Magnetococcales bacterium]